MKTIRRSTFVIIGASLVAAAVVSGCDDELVDDATFRLWCGSSLCSWTLDSGHVRPAPTWNKGDLGVELVDTPTRISQPLKHTARCLEFTTVADVSETAQVTVGLDFNDDGVIDYSQPIAKTGFREVVTQITAPYTTRPPRLFITKNGDGRAVLAQMSLRTADGCSAPAIRLQNSAIGEGCTQGSPNECASGVCCEGICAECCLGPSPLDFGEDGGVVSAPIVPCADGGTCERRSVPQTGSLAAIVPLQCDPGKRIRASGAVCLADDDCASGECTGATSEAAGFSNAPDGCASARFPDAGDDLCSFTHVHQGHCR